MSFQIFHVHEYVRVDSVDARKWLEKIALSVVQSLNCANHTRTQLTLDY